MNQEKYAVDIVHDGAAGLDYAMSGIYDVIVLDIMLPQKNGYQVVHELRTNKVTTL
jgi:DNA-binding response OmpR family regulator